jgi:hypothetical protein
VNTGPGARQDGQDKRGVELAKGWLEMSLDQNHAHNVFVVSCPSEPRGGDKIGHRKHDHRYKYLFFPYNASVSLKQPAPDATRKPAPTAGRGSG